MKLSTKLIGGFAAVACISLVVGFVGLRYLNTVNDAETYLYGNMTIPIGKLVVMESDFQLLRVYSRDMMFAKTQEQRDAIAKKSAATTDDLESASTDFEKTIDNDNLKKQFAEYRAAFKDYHDNYYTKIVSLAEQGKLAEAQAILTRDDAKNVVARTGDALDKLVSTKSEDAHSIDVENDRTTSRAHAILEVCIAVGFLLSITAGWFITRSITRPIAEVVRVLEGLSSGDLSQRLQVNSRDEIGQMAQALNQSMEKLGETMSLITGNAQALASSSEELTAVSQQMSANAEETAAQANVVSAAGEQVSKNVQTVATATEEMNASIKEIAKNAQEAAKVASSAVTTAQGTNATVGKLGESSAEIGQVIKVITSIAQQTNLLALNATIEAARAGEAGKGFAVVANEVKELAKETAKATEDISQKIEAIQVDTKSAVGAIAEITSIINQINDISGTIASAVEEQTATTNEIARNIGEAAKGSSDIAENVVSVASAAKSTTEGANQTQTAASELARMATELDGLVAQFKVETGVTAQKRRSPATAKQPAAKHANNREPAYVA